MNMSYANRFQQKNAVASYEAEEYGADSYSTSIWRMQRPVVEKILNNFRQAQSGPVRLLDFACGTGRVLSALESAVDSAEGIDISENMVAVARTRCTRARLLVGDVLRQPELLQKNYDVISCFRFILNVEPEIRVQILRRLRQVLRQPDGLLLVNVHGNSRSLRHPAIVWRRWRERPEQDGLMLNEMSPDETKKLFRENGFEIVHQFGFGILPPTIYRTPFRHVARALDHKFAGENGWNNWSIDMLFACRPR
jgi:ubiquinone/menaquinone biosynthesis C-methylase UbiE